AQALDRLTVVTLRGITLAEQRARTRLDPECPVGAGSLRNRFEACERVGRQIRLVAPDGRFDELAQGPARRTPFVLVPGRFPCRDRRLLVSPQAVRQHGVRPLREELPEPLAAGGDFAQRGVDDVDDLLLA